MPSTWLCRSMKPAVTTWPVASSSSAAGARPAPMATTLPFAIATSAISSRPDSGSVTRPPRNTRSGTVDSEREAVGLRPRGDPLPLGELVPAALRAEPAAVNRGTGAAERRVRVVVQRLVVDMHDAGAQPVGDLEAALH